MQVPLHLRVEDGRAATAPVHLTLAAMRNRKVHLDVHLQPITRTRDTATRHAARLAALDRSQIAVTVETIGADFHRA